MTEQRDTAASMREEREEIAARIARFKATQEKFNREREQYFVATLNKARHSKTVRHTFERPPFWP